MRQPIKRYTCFFDTYCLADYEEDAEGMWVMHSDYAVLAAENERLRNAGDAMAEFMEPDNWTHPEYPLVQAWIAAKEGRDAK